MRIPNSMVASNPVWECIDCSLHFTHNHYNPTANLNSTSKCCPSQSKPRVSRISISLQHDIPSLGHRLVVSVFTKRISVKKNLSIQIHSHILTVRCVRTKKKHFQAWHKIGVAPTQCPCGRHTSWKKGHIYTHTSFLAQFQNFIFWTCNMPVSTNGVPLWFFR